ncbi:glycerol-3-phosphate dehydrogenase/oxidase [Microtetraspora fusca]|uniref:Glycerol-3-phosphate dehydrogenase/oxidase n=1 Tax=Microtetraspora fusca TaxID=1997 RepID=A0ABW6VH12_MICFU
MNQPDPTTSAAPSSAYPSAPDGLTRDTAGTPEALRRRRAEALGRLARGVDLVVIGAGVNGVGIAWDAAARGLRVALLDKGDVGSGTSSWSSRMVHGGLKYLEQKDVRLVRESLREREWLLQAAPHLVKPLRFVLPFYRGNAHGKAVLRLGMVAYDVLSFDKTVDHHRVYSKEQLLRLCPGLSPDGLQGGAAYYDAQVEFAERMVLETAIAATAEGATVLTYAQVDEILLSGDRVRGVGFTDRLTGERHEIAAPVVVNASGPWVDQTLAAALGERAGVRRMGGTKGSHYVVDPFPGAPDQAFYYEAHRDGRPLMVIPWLGRYLIGSTDLRFDGDLDSVRSDEEELAYILEETNRIIPSARLTPADVRYSYCGVRPLPYDADKPEGDISRRHLLVDHAPDVIGLISVIGGKLTTFRGLAEEAVDEIMARRSPRLPRLSRRWTRRRSATARMRLPGARALDLDAFAREFTASSGLPAASAARLVRVYGTRAADIAALAAADPRLAEVVDEATGTIAAQVVFAVREEFATTIADVVARRTMIGLEPDLGVPALERIGAVLAEHCGWDAERVERDIAGYRTYIHRLSEIG